MRDRKGGTGAWISLQQRGIPPRVDLGSRMTRGMCVTSQLPQTERGHNARQAQVRVDRQATKKGSAEQYNRTVSSEGRKGRANRSVCTLTGGMLTSSHVSQRKGYGFSVVLLATLAAPPPCPPAPCPASCGRCGCGAPQLQRQGPQPPRPEAPSSLAERESGEARGGGRGSPREPGWHCTAPGRAAAAQRLCSGRASSSHVLVTMSLRPRTTRLQTHCLNSSFMAEAPGGPAA